MSDEENEVVDVTPELPPGPSEEVIAWVEQLTGYLESPGRQEALWCPQWQEHPEAVWRFDALYEAFVEAFMENTVSSWWVNHFDRHAPLLFGPTGVFESCENGHDPARPFRFARRP